MRIRILCLITICVLFSFFSLSSTGLSPGGMVFAGGDGGNNASKPKKETKQKNSKSKEQKAREKAIRGSLRAIDLTIASLEKAAKNNNLRRILNSSRRVTSMRAGIDTMYAELDGTEHENKPQKVYDKLNEYARQKDNKELKANARNLIIAIAADRHFGAALEARQGYKDAMKKGDVKAAINHRVDYDNAREDFHREADRLPRETRNKLFFKLPREIE